MIEPFAWSYFVSKRKDINCSYHIEIWASNVRSQGISSIALTHFGRNWLVYISVSYWPLTTTWAIMLMTTIEMMTVEEKTSMTVMVIAKHITFITICISTTPSDYLAVTKIFIYVSFISLVSESFYQIRKWIAITKLLSPCSTCHIGIYLMQSAR